MKNYEIVNIPIKTSKYLISPSKFNIFCFIPFTLLSISLIYFEGLNLRFYPFFKVEFTPFLLLLSSSILMTFFIFYFSQLCLGALTKWLNQYLFLSKTLLEKWRSNGRINTYTKTHIHTIKKYLILQFLTWFEILQNLGSMNNKI
jgi:hypothetical protein